MLIFVFIFICNLYVIIKTWRRDFQYACCLPFGVRDLINHVFSQNETTKLWTVETIYNSETYP